MCVSRGNINSKIAINNKCFFCIDLTSLTIYDIAHLHSVSCGLNRPSPCSTLGNECVKPSHFLLYLLNDGMPSHILIRRQKATYRLAHRGRGP